MSTRDDLGGVRVSLDTPKPQKRATVFFMPQSETDLVICKPCWAADDGYETAVFPTQAEAIAFCWKQWRVPAERVRIKEVG